MAAHLRPATRKDINPGDTIIPSPLDGLGVDPFLVKEVRHDAGMHCILVLGRNGHEWWVREEGIQVIR